MWPGSGLMIILLSSFILGFQVVDGAAVKDVESLSFHGNHRRYPSIRAAKGDKGAKRKRVRFTVRLHLPDVVMSQPHNDEGTHDLNQLSKQLTRDIQALFARTPGQQRVYNMKFSHFKKEDRHRQRQKEFPNRGQFRSFDSDVQNLAGRSGFTESKRLKTTLATTRPTKEISSFMSSDLSSSSDSLSSDVRTESSRTDNLELFANAPTDFHLFDSTATSAKATLTTKKPQQLTSQEKLEDLDKSTQSLEIKPAKDTLNVPRVTRLFKECYGRSETDGEYVIFLDRYINAYRDLMKIFDFFGSIFSFAADDVKNKLSTLQKLREKDLANSEDNYLTFKSMFAYEYSPEGAHANYKGTATNKWIHRPLKFISSLVKALRNKDSGKTMKTWATELYSDILAPHHDWYVRMGVYVALVSFPSRDTLLERMDIKDTPSGMQKLADFFSVMDALYDDVQKLYVEYS